MESYDSLIDAIEGLKKRGFVHDFELEYNAIKLKKEKKEYLPDEFNVIEIHRFEGMSSTDDNCIVFAVEGNDGKKGYLLDAYGVYGGTQISPELIEKLKNTYQS